MKRLFSLTLLTLVLSITAFAQEDDRSMLKLRLSDRSLISVNLDGKYIYRETVSLTLDGIRPGAHRLEVFAESGGRRRPVRIYTGTIRLQPGTINLGVVDVYARSLRLRTRPLDDNDYAGTQGGRANGSYDDPRDDYGRNEQGDRRDDRTRDDIYNRDNHNDRDDHTADNANGEGYGSYPRGRGNAGSNMATGGRAFSQRDMDDLRQRVADRITDSDKEQLLKTALSGRTVFTEQVRQMLGWLSFDDTRLDFAKWAYGQVSDRDNYWKLEDAFSFSSSKEEFAKAIRRR